MKKSKIRRIENIKVPNRSINLNIFKFCEKCKCVRKHNEGLKYIISNNTDPFSEAINQDLCAFCKCLTCGSFKSYKDREEYINMIKGE
ncbi:hypothetical protein [Rosenbergiella epipactidis]|uniref:hypothetical protein n=1 Tax=Rosenbergiella epipactidis TaxID=1544694 RepID=UPI001F4E5E39|nr:hypothetical protein [Rosenbergiella epipactidis]